LSDIRETRTSIEDLDPPFFLVKKRAVHRIQKSWQKFTPLYQ
jgi:hypothetical protein